MLDTGSCLNLVGIDFLKNTLNLQESDIVQTGAKIRGISGDTFPAYGEVVLSIKILGKVFKIQFLVI